MRFTKEIRVSGSEGMLVCRELLDTFVSLGIKAPTAHALVNDTVAAMLGGYIPGILVGYFTNFFTSISTIRSEAGFPSASHV